MTVSELYGKLDKIIPPSLSCQWDNDGLMVCPDRDAEIRKILFSLDATDGAVEYAVKNGFDTIITHHPLVFNKLSSVTDPLIIKLIKNGISVMSFHTRLDALCGGVNTVLAQKLGIEIKSYGFTEGLGAVGKIRPTAAKDLSEYVKSVLSSPAVFYADGGRPCENIAVLGGACGKENLEDALSTGCDTVITGNIGYNAMLDYSRLGLNIIMAGHYYTEKPVTEMLIETVRGIHPTAVCEIFADTPVKAV